MAAEKSDWVSERLQAAVAESIKPAEPMAERAKREPPSLPALVSQPTLAVAAKKLDDELGIK
ncbi:MAG: hypothetical protein M0006_04790 [Magnetospirillum sp.]|nr:hypothetical protein [Magnetospirillum sp.]